jgi:hypothetical protein
LNHPHPDVHRDEAATRAHGVEGAIVIADGVNLPYNRAAVNLG